MEPNPPSPELALQTPQTPRARSSFCAIDFLCSPIEAEVSLDQKQLESSESTLAKRQSHTTMDEVSFGDVEPPSRETVNSEESRESASRPDTESSAQLLPSTVDRFQSVVNFRPELPPLPVQAFRPRLDSEKTLAFVEANVIEKRPSSVDNTFDSRSVRYESAQSHGMNSQVYDILSLNSRNMPSAESPGDQAKIPKPRPNPALDNFRDNKIPTNYTPRAIESPNAEQKPQQTYHYQPNNRRNEELESIREQIVAKIMSRRNLPISKVPSTPNTNKIQKDVKKQRIERKREEVPEERKEPARQYNPVYPYGYQMPRYDYDKRNPYYQVPYPVSHVYPPVHPMQYAPMPTSPYPAAPMPADTRMQGYYPYGMPTAPPTQGKEGEYYYPYPYYK